MSTAYKFIGLRIDIESRSRTDLRKSGVYRYCEDPDFRVLIISYAPLREYPGGAIKLGAIRRVDMANPDPQFAAVLRNPGFQKHAYNAAFERVALSKWLGMPNGTYLDPENWRCSAIKANTAGVFGSLDAVARAARTPVGKDPEGKRLIRLFSIPQKGGSFVEPEDAPEDFLRFESYCDQDVLTEALVAQAVPAPPDFVQAEYEADQRINDRGFRHFKALSQQAVVQVATEKDRLMVDLTALTGLANPNSIQQMRGWLDENNYPMVSLDKAHREEALLDPMCPPLVKDVLIMKGAASLSSVSKHTAALNTRCEDGRIRGSLQFYGAHTGREAGRGIQPQNLPRQEASAAERALLLSGQAGRLAPEIAKGSARASIVPARDHVFVVFDYNAIEARVLAGLAGEKWAEAEFRGDGKIYEATAQMMFGVDKQLLIKSLKLCGKCGTCADCRIRGRGKVSNLALGYAGSAGALVTMGAEKEGIDVGNYPSLNAEWKALGKPGKFHEWERDRHDYPELLALRDAYRQASPATVRFWKLCAKGFDRASEGKAARFGQNGMLVFMRDGHHNRLVLPSGRSIWYRFAKTHMVLDRFGEPRVDRRTFIGKAGGIGHARIDTHGGKLTENVTQAVARDLLFDLIMRIEALTAKGWPGRIVLHVHDEVVVEVHKNHAQQVFDDIEGMMQIAPAWGQAFVVKGEGNIMERYRK